MVATVRGPARRTGDAARSGPVRRCPQPAASRSILRMTTVPADPRGAPGRVAVVVVTFNSADVVPGLLASLPAGLAGPRLDPRRGGQRLARRHRRGGGVARPRRRGRAVRPQRGLRGRHQPRCRAGAGPVAPCSCSTRTSAWVPGCVPELVAALGRTGAGIVVPRLDDAARPASSRRAAASRPCAVRSRTRSSGRNGPVRSRTWVRSSPTPAPTRSSRPRTGPRARRSSSPPRAGTPSGRGTSRTSCTPRRPTSRCAPATPGYPTWFVPTAHAVHLEGGSAGNPGLWRLLVANRLRLYGRRHGPGRDGRLLGGARRP